MLHFTRKRLLGGAAVLGTALTLAATGCSDEGSPDGAGGESSGSGGNSFGFAGSFGDGQGGDSSGSGDCGGQDVEATPAVVNVMFVVDKSGSMDDTPSGFSDTKWESLITSLNTALPDVQDDINMGLKLYPDGDGDACSMDTSGVSVAIGSGSSVVEAIDAELTAVGTPEGATPTADALTVALDYFTTGAGKDLEGTNYVVLATDGGPNCNESNDACVCSDNPDGNPSCGQRDECTTNIDNEAEENSVCDLDGSWGSCCTSADDCLDDAGALAAVEALDDAGIKTIVVGIPGSEAYGDVLDALAVAGKLPASDTSPKYNKVEDAAGLTTTLRDITRTVIRSCDVELEMRPPALNEVNVFLDGEVVPKDDEEGWKYVDANADPVVIELTGSVCSDVETRGVEAISVEFGCPTVILK